ncbi:MAG: hypothetical protein ACR2NW_01130 [Thermodesulfobacteriota bacterium]
MRLMKIISIIFLFVCITFGTIGGCGSSGDGDGPILKGISCEELVAIMCDRADECGFVLVDECLFSYMFEDLVLACEEFIDEFNSETRVESILQTPSEDCMADMDNFNCNAFDNFDLPASCGDGWFIPDIPIPVNPCGEGFAAQCERTATCDTVTFEQCLVSTLFLTEAVIGANCNASLEGPNFDQCIEDIANLDCASVNLGVTPASCIDQLILVEDPPSEGVCDECVTNADCAEGQICIGCSQNCTGAVSRCVGLLIAECPDGLF